MNGFEVADIEKLEVFYDKSKEAITEFASIRQKFEDINKELLKNWQGLGSAAYKNESDHILENVGGIKDVLDTINEEIVKDIIETYKKVDKQLAENNRKAGEPEEEKNNE